MSTAHWAGVITEKFKGIFWEKTILSNHFPYNSFTKSFQGTFSKKWWRFCELASLISSFHCSAEPAHRISSKCSGKMVQARLRALGPQPPDHQRISMRLIIRIACKKRNFPIALLNQNVPSPILCRSIVRKASNSSCSISLFEIPISCSVCYHALSGRLEAGIRCSGTPKIKKFKPIRICLRCHQIGWWQLRKRKYFSLFAKAIAPRCSFSCT